MNAETIYYREELALIHDRGFGFHAALCAPGVLALLEPLRDRGGLILELGCGSGHLTRYLVDAGHRVIATDASPSMLSIARQAVAGVEQLERLILPDAPLPPVDAVVSIGHVFNYLASKQAIRTALISVAGALKPGGLLVMDVQDLKWGAARRDTPNQSHIADNWVLISEFSVPKPSMFVRRHISFVRSDDGNWRRDEEVHRNVLIDTDELPSILAEHKLDAQVATSFGNEVLPEGLMTLIGRKQI